LSVKDFFAIKVAVNTTVMVRRIISAIDPQRTSTRRGTGALAGRMRVNEQMERLAMLASVLDLIA
jgi:hypothetical protein